MVGHLPAFARDMTALLRRGHGEHGKLFRLNLAGKPAVVLLDREHCKFFFTEPEEKVSIRRPYEFLRSMFGSDSFFLTDPVEYQRQRALYLAVLRNGELRKYIRIMEEHTRDLVRRMGEQGELDIVRTCVDLTLKIAGHAVLGRELGKSISDRPQLFLDFSANVHLLYPEWLRPVRTVRSRIARRRLRAEVAGYLNYRREHPQQPPDYMQTLCDSRYDDGRPVPDSCLVSQALGLVWAGRETTAGQLGWALADVMTHTQHQAEILAELEQLDPHAPFTVEGMHRLTFLDRFLWESHRLHPLAPVLAREAVQDLEIGGCHVPRGAVLITSPYLVHRLPDEFPDPEEFRPERFAEGSQVSHNLMLFGGGTHRCPGQNFARLEIKVVLALLLRHFHLELVDEPTPASDQVPRDLRAPCRMRYRAR